MIILKAAKFIHCILKSVQLNWKENLFRVQCVQALTTKSVVQTQLDTRTFHYATVTTFILQI